MQEKFEPTHVLVVGEGKKRSQYRVKISDPIGRGKVDKLLYYNAIISPRSKLYRKGTHFVSMVPETNLKEIQK
jgi:hypothetical protein